MPFVRSATPRYFAPASFKTLNADGQLVDNKFDCEFKRLKSSEMKQLQTEMAQWGSDVIRRLRERAEALAKAAQAGGPVPGADDAPDMNRAVEDVINRKLLEKVMTGWRAVEDAEGVPLPFSMEAVDLTEEEFQGFINACTHAFWKSCAPQEAAHLAAKN